MSDGSDSEAERRESEASRTETAAGEDTEREPSKKELVERSLSETTAATFNERVESQATALEVALERGELDNEEFTVGLEMEVYAVADDGESIRLARLPDSFFECGATKELGLHNAEINTEPDVLDGDGLASQAREIEAQVAAAREAAREAGCRIVLDAMWTVPPDEGTDRYFTDVERDGDVVFAQNMRSDPRYYAIDTDVLDHAGGAIPFDVPGVNREFPSMLFESLATSIQPHVQIPDVTSVPDYYNVAIRTLGPVLALSTNSPFLPPDLYTDVADPERLVEETHHELRIAVFEQSVNQSPNAKVRVPDDIEETEAVFSHVVADDLCAPFLREWIADEPREQFADRHWEYRYKRSTFWRWVRCVVGGDAVPGAADERSIRLEYRPIPTQPTVRDVVSLQCLTTGLVRGLAETAHPLGSLSWEKAKRSFYNASRDGLGAELAWIREDGEYTDDADEIFAEVFEYARQGLELSGVPEGDIDRYVDPVERRWEHRTTPSDWKKRRVRDHLDAGEGLTAAITSMQREYVEKSSESETFADWL